MADVMDMQLPDKEAREAAAASGRMVDGNAVVKTLHIERGVHNGEKLYLAVEFKVRSFTDTQGKEHDEYKGRTINHRFWVGTDQDPMADGRGGQDRELYVKTWTKDFGGQNYYRFLERAGVPGTTLAEQFDYINGNQPDVVLTLKTAPKMIRLEDGTKAVDPSGKHYQNIDRFIKLVEAQGGAVATPRAVPRMAPPAVVVGDEDDD